MLKIRDADGGRGRGRWDGWGVDAGVLSRRQACTAAGTHSEQLVWV